MSENGNRLLFGRRKFTIALLALVMSFVGLAFGWLDGGQWVTAIGLDIGLYSGAEMGETIAKSRA